MRWRDQRNEAVRGESKSRYLQAAIRKYGWDGFDHQVLSTATTQAELDNLEKVWIILFQATNRKFGYNLMNGGAAGTPSIETRQRLSEAAKRRHRLPLSVETKAKISAAQRGVSKPISEKARIARTQNPLILANCQKMGATHKGKPWSDARRAAQGGIQ
jgi:hypothetical protein